MSPQSFARALAIRTAVHKRGAAPPPLVAAGETYRDEEIGATRQTECFTMSVDMLHHGVRTQGSSLSAELILTSRSRRWAS
jgi:hypothetical protein